MPSNPPYDDDWSGESVNLETGMRRTRFTDFKPMQDELIKLKAERDGLQTKVTQLVNAACEERAKFRAENKALLDALKEIIKVCDRDTHLFARAKALIEHSEPQ